MTAVSTPPDEGRAGSRGADRPLLPVFPNYTQMPRKLPVQGWRWVRLGVFALGLVEIGLLLVVPDLGLDLFFGIAVPALPLLWVVAPGVWRNLCPLAAANQTPRLFGFTRAITAPRWVAEHGFLIGVGLLVLLIPARKWLLNDNGPALAVLLLVLLLLAFLGGVVLKGKSGWCSTMCPLLPVQRLYSQQAFINSPNSHCEPCLACAKNCVDFNPHVAHLADQYDNDRTWMLRRRLFAAGFPGLIVSFYVIPDPPEVSVPELYGLVLLGIFVSAGSFFLLDALLRLPLGRLPALYAAAALNLYYWWTSEVTLQRWGVDAAAPVWTWRALILALSVVWWLRFVAKERAFVTVTAGTATPPRAGGAAAARRRRAAEAGAVGSEVTIVNAEGQETRVAVAEGVPLLEVIEDAGLPIEAGCRLGFCGSDPIALLEGADVVNPPGSDEEQTLHRLGLGPSTRMACVTRPTGSCRVSLVPEPGGVGPVAAPPFTVDPDVRHVVVVGNGIAGVTAADFVRRFTADCTIDLIGREPHHLYNRMAISRLVYGRSAMQGLYLQKDAWYDDRQITTWLNTEATAIDRVARTVHLGTGDIIPYDRLILATGSRSFMPEVPGMAGPGVFALREAEDAIAVRRAAQAQGCKLAVVAGGGLLGLEAAYALSKVNLDVTVLERGPHLLRRQLDARSASLLRSYLANLGITVIEQAELGSVERDAAGLMLLKTTSGRRLPCDLLLVATGISPNDDLAARAGLVVDRGIVVDAGMRTSDPRVLAAGDCAAVDGQIVGLWPPAVRQAEIVARNSLGDDLMFVPKPPVTILKVAGVDLVSLGRVQAARGEHEIVDEDPAAHRYRKLVVAPDGRVQGAILLGHPDDLPAVTKAVEGALDVRRIFQRMAAGDWRALAEAGAIG